MRNRTKTMHRVADQHGLRPWHDLTAKKLKSLQSKVDLAASEDIDDIDADLDSREDVGDDDDLSDVVEQVATPATDNSTDDADTQVVKKRRRVKKTTDQD